MDPHTKQPYNTSSSGTKSANDCYGMGVDLSSKHVIKKLLKHYGLRPSKRLGQNFLIDKRVFKKIIEAAELAPQDIVLEIGPGIGNLTQELAKKVHPVKSSQSEVFTKGEQFNRVKKIIAVEKDPKMIEVLRETLKDFNNIVVIQGDILKLKLQINSKIQIPKNYKIVANLPYYIVSPVIRKFLESVEARPQQMVLMVQKEVAQRICAKPPRMNLLAVSVQFYSTPEVVYFVSKKSFWPQPKVDSAILKITPYPKPKLTRNDLVSFFRIVKAGFSQPRKQLINNLSRLRQGFGGQARYDKEEIEEWLLKNKIRPDQRAETLKIEDWLNLTKSYNPHTK